MGFGNFLTSLKKRFIKKGPPRPWVDSEGASENSPTGESVESGEVPVSGRALSKFRSKIQNQNISQNLRAFGSKISAKLPKNVKGFAAQTALNAGGFVKKKGASFWGTGTTIVLCTYFLADLSSIVIEQMLPEPPPIKQVKGGGAGRKSFKSLSDFDGIWARNLVNSKFKDEKIEVQDSSDDGPPVRTSLPLRLVGTLVLEDSTRSLATLQDTSISRVYPVRALDEIPRKLKVITVEPYRVVFRNLENRRKEFVDLPSDFQQATPIKRSTSPKGPGVSKIAPRRFNVSRAEIDSTMADINKVLTQARAVPHFENGAPAGYKLFQIVPGSIYSKLGLVDGDVIKGINGEEISDPGKAFQMLGELQETNHVELQIKRNGTVETMIYDIN